MNTPNQTDAELDQITPNLWFTKRYPRLAERYGHPVLERCNKDDVLVVKDINDDFFASLFGELGCPDAPTVFIPEENCFYRYQPSAGVYAVVEAEELSRTLSDLLLQCARECAAVADTSALQFALRGDRLNRIVRRARASLSVASGFFESAHTEYLPCANGMLRLADRALLPFSPSYRRRNRLAVAYDASVQCPRFLGTLMRPALNDSDLDLVQRCSALALMGVNVAQRIVMFTGTAGGGKGTLIRVLTGIIGKENVGSLRPNLLMERFELGRAIGKTLLYGADVSQQALNCGGATALKSLTGGDPMTAEFKGSNECVQVCGNFNVFLTSNSTLALHLEGDRDAWMRRLVLIRFTNPAPTNKIVDLSEQILAQEASGVLNWMLEGYEKLRADKFQIRLDERQQQLVSDMLLESEAHVLFAQESLVRDSASSVTVTEVFEAYTADCHQRGRTPLNRKAFTPQLSDWVARQFGLCIRNDIVNASGKNQRGWRGIRLKTQAVEVNSSVALELDLPQVTTTASTSAPDTSDTSGGAGQVQTHSACGSEHA
jgi:putative DNA primase/helicase